MKKALSLVLALILVLTAVSALAADSPKKPVTGGKATEVEIGVNFITDTAISGKIIDGINEKYQETGSMLAGLPQSILDRIPATFVNMNELRTAQFEGNVAGVTDEVTITVKFDTDYFTGTGVLVLIGILPETEDGEVEWDVFDGEGTDDGSVKVTIPKAIFEKIQTNPFLIGVISE